MFWLIRLIRNDGWFIGWFFVWIVLLGVVMWICSFWCCSCRLWFWWLLRYMNGGEMFCGDGCLRYVFWLLVLWLWKVCWLVWLMCVYRWLGWLWCCVCCDVWYVVSWLVGVWCLIGEIWFLVWVFLLLCGSVVWDWWVFLCCRYGVCGCLVDWGLGCLVLVFCVCLLCFCFWNRGRLGLVLFWRYWNLVLVCVCVCGLFFWVFVNLYYLVSLYNMYY